MSVYTLQISDYVASYNVQVFQHIRYVSSVNCEVQTAL
jgi:hypothetical protein